MPLNPTYAVFNICLSGKGQLLVFLWPSYPIDFVLDTALPWLLSNLPVKCEVYTVIKKIEGQKERLLLLDTKIFVPQTALYWSPGSTCANMGEGYLPSKLNPLTHLWGAKRFFSPCSFILVDFHLALTLSHAGIDGPRDSPADTGNARLMDSSHKTQGLRGTPSFHNLSSFQSVLKWYWLETWHVQKKQNCYVVDIGSPEKSWS